MGKFAKGADLHKIVQQKLEEADSGQSDEQVIEEIPEEGSTEDGAADETSTPASEENNSDSTDAGNDDVQSGGESDSPDEGEYFDVKTAEGTIRVTREELLSGYMRQADYTRKTQDLSRQRAELNNVKPKADDKEPPAEEHDPYSDLELGEFASEESKKLLEVLKREGKKRAKLEAEMADIRGFADKNKGKQRLEAMKREFERIAPLHGFPAERFTPVAVYKRMGESLPDENGKPYGERYTLEMAINDVKMDFPDQAGDPLKALKANPKEWDAIKADIIDEYRKSKQKIKEDTFSPSTGGSQKPPATKEKFNNPKDAIAHVKGMFKK